MKKHDAGYALPFVLVVMVVLCLVAVSIMSFSLRNLQSQQATVQRMQDQYKAQGEIEKVVARLTSDTSETDLQSICGEAVEHTITSQPNDPLKVTLEASVGTVKIVCEIEVADAITYKSYTVSEAEGGGEG